MTEADVDAVAEIRVRGWQFAYDGLMPRDYLDALSVTEDAARRRLLAAGDGQVVNLVAEDARGVLGWAAYGPWHDGGQPDGTGELYALYIRPELIGTGVGRALCTAVIERAAERGYARLLLMVVKGNTRARGFYERAGFVADGTEETYEVRGALVPEVRYVLEQLGPPSPSWGCPHAV